jgi:hypothetical protein
MTRRSTGRRRWPGKTYKIKWPEQSDHAIYITLNDIVQDGRRRPFEIFINSKNIEHYAWTVALTRMISAVFRRGGDVSFVVEELKAVFDPARRPMDGGRYVPSLLAAIGECDRAPHDRDRLSTLGTPANGGGRTKTRTRTARAHVSALRQSQPVPRRGMLDVLGLHVFALRLGHARRTPNTPLNRNR